MKNQKGITLIALVVTIIVLLILAGVSITLIVGNESIIKRALDAKSLYLDGEGKDKEALDSFGDFLGSYAGESGSNPGAGTDNNNYPAAGSLIEELKNDSNQVIGELIADGKGGGIPVPDGFHFVGGTEQSGAVISDSTSDKNKYVGQEDIGNDLVGNQFVFIPCTTTGEEGKIAYAKDTTYNQSGGKQSQYVGYEWSDNNVNTASVEKYGGFYIGRYEAGVPSNASFYASEDGDTYIHDSSTTNSIGTKDVVTENGVDLVPVSKANNQVWNRISHPNAMTLAERMYSSSSSVTSSLVDSYAWDTTCNFIAKDVADKATYLTDSRSYGNYYNANLDVTLSNVFHALHLVKTHIQKRAVSLAAETGTPTYSVGNVTLGGHSVTDPAEIQKVMGIYYDERDLEEYEYTNRIELGTGVTNLTRTKNIYDLAGNMIEMTSETRTDDSNTIVIRGGFFMFSGTAQPVVMRTSSQSSYNEVHIGFRVAMYLK